MQYAIMMNQPYYNSISRPKIVHDLYIYINSLLLVLVLLGWAQCLQWQFTRDAEFGIYAAAGGAAV